MVIRHRPGQWRPMPGKAARSSPSVSPTRRRRPSFVSMSRRRPCRTRSLRNYWRTMGWSTTRTRPTWGRAHLTTSRILALPNRRSGGAGTRPVLGRQEEMATDHGALGGSAVQAAPSGQAVPGSLNPQQAFSPVESPTVQDLASRTFKSEGNGQPATAPSDLQRRGAAKALDGGRGEAAELQLTEKNSPRKLAAASQKQDRRPVPAPGPENLSQAQTAPGHAPGSSIGSKPMIYQVNASPEQFAIVLKQIGERADYFSLPKPEPLSYFAYGDMNGGGGTGGQGLRGGGMGGGFAANPRRKCDPPMPMQQKRPSSRRRSPRLPPFPSPFPLRPSRRSCRPPGLRCSTWCSF